MCHESVNGDVLVGSPISLAVVVAETRPPVQGIQGQKQIERASCPACQGNTSDSRLYPVIPKDLVRTIISTRSSQQHWSSFNQAQCVSQSSPPWAMATVATSASIPILALFARSPQCLNGPKRRETLAKLPTRTLEFVDRDKKGILYLNL